MVFLVGTLILLVLIALSLPVGFALGLAGVFSLLMLVPSGSVLALMAKVVHGTASSYVILTIPMFVLMAELLGSGGVAQDLLIACNRLMHRIKGGMAIACVMAGAVLASASGSSTASAASITRAAFPVMQRAGYAASFALGTIAMSGTLAIMIPPSVSFVLYGVMTENSIGKLFIAGITPGLLTAAGYIVTITIVLMVKPQLGPKPEMEAELAVAAGNGRVWPMGILLAVVIGGLYSGLATPTEISAIGAFGALIISFATGRMNQTGFVAAIGNTLRTTTLIVTIIFGAHLFGYFISFTKITDNMLNMIAASGVSPTVVLLMVVGVYLLLGMIMDQVAIIILTAPITAPLMVGLGYDPIWWGVIMIKTAEIGLVSPPLGLNVFVACGSAKQDIKDGFTGVLPFLVAEFVILGLLLAFPGIALWLT
ncbi:TRAP transporter large permease [Afifella sp. IM 167]|uniref:TRAP transporter large permease n=1 Tax=Afifella sp. IM 167 TaxID=2033586 RepID=UPI001CC929CE|nr:TRAP transporter large permease [Afifella sp. IM 167]MBZ8134649.1 C4-dicarboxylate ABC transporter permease [Afifella sp. IM 167]